MGIMQHGSAFGMRCSYRAWLGRRRCASSPSASTRRARSSTPSPRAATFVSRRGRCASPSSGASGYHSTRRSRGARRPARRAAARCRTHWATNIMRSVWGMLVEVEPRGHLGYSNDYRPDVSVAGAGRSRSRLVGDVKFKDSLSSNPEDVGQRGAFVGLGNTEPGTSADVFGLEQRGAVGDGDFRPSDGGGYVAYKKADCAHARSRSDTDVQMYLFETFGGWCNAVKRLFYQMKDKVRNKLSKRQHEDEASWSTRSWLSLQAQRMSVALQLAGRGGGREIAT